MPDRLCSSRSGGYRFLPREAPFGQPPGCVREPSSPTEGSKEKPLRFVKRRGCRNLNGTGIDGAAVPPP